MDLYFAAAINNLSIIYFPPDNYKLISNSVRGEKMIAGQNEQKRGRKINVNDKTIIGHGFL